MTASEILKRIKNQGCTVEMADEQIKVSGPLTDELRALIRKHKAELVAELKRQQETCPFADMFQKALTAISKKYQEGTMEHVKLHHPDLFKEIGEAEAAVDTLWRQGLAGKTTLAEFREVLLKYYKLNLKAIDLVRTDGFSGVVRQVFAEPTATDPGPALATGVEKNNQQGQLFLAQGGTLYDPNKNGQMPADTDRTGNFIPPGP